MQVKVIKDVQVVVYILPLLAAELILLIVWQSVAPLTPAERKISGLGTFERKMICSNDDSSKVQGFVVVFFAWKAFLLVLACFMAYLTRNLPDVYSESKSVSFSLYNILVVGAVFIPILGTLELNPEPDYILTCVGILVAANVTGIALFFYRLQHVVWENPESNTVVTSSTQKKSSSNSDS